jgi:hypothetical protein
MRSLLALLALLPLCVHAGEVYRIRQLSEKQIVNTYIQMLRDACANGDRDWTNSSFDPAAGYWGDGVSLGNQGIRTVASMALACATLVKYDNTLPSELRRALTDKTIAAIRFTVATHITGPQKCPDGKQWGSTEPPGRGNWQSGMWTGTFAWAAWLVWDHLDGGLRQGVERVVASECDALARGHPPTGLWLDTKAEENGWDIPPLVLGELMFPDHPHVAAWHESAEEYMMNTLCTAADLQDTNIVDGKPVNQWVRGANLQPDFTLENHNFFHPSYVGCSSYFMTQASLYFTYARQPVPQAAEHHLLDTWRMFQTVLLPWGEPACPQGMDWELHGLPFLNLYASLATRRQDPLAAHLEQQSLQYIRAWQAMHHGELDIPGSRFGLTRHAVNAEQASYGLLAHKIFGPAAGEMSNEAAVKKNIGVWDHPWFDFIIHRTEKKFASFSWKNKIMGVLMPIAPGHESNPEFIVPLPNGFVGSFDLAPRGDVKTTVLEHTRRETTNGFETTGALLINGGRLKQTLRMTSIGEQTVVYEDIVVAQSNITVRAERGLPIGIENDQITGNTRTLTDATGQTTFTFGKVTPAKAISGNWANVGGRLGMVTIDGAGMAYFQGTGYLPGICVCADTLYGSYNTNSRAFKPGEVVAHRIAVVCVETSPKETAALAKSCLVKMQPGSETLEFTQPDGTKGQASLFGFSQ